MWVYGLGRVAVTGREGSIREGDVYRCGGDLVRGRYLRDGSDASTERSSYPSVTQLEPIVRYPHA